MLKITKENSKLEDKITVNTTLFRNKIKKDFPESNSFVVFAVFFEIFISFIFGGKKYPPN